MNELVKPLLTIARMNTKLFLNVLDGFDDKTAQLRINNKTNSAVFAAIHIADARFFLVKYLGGKIENPYEESFADVKTIDDIKKYPSLEEIKKDWEYVSAALVRRVQKVSDEILLSDSEYHFPVSDKTVLGGLAFMMQHESYHIGQIGLIRKYQGLPAMSYK